MFLSNVIYVYVHSRNQALSTISLVPSLHAPLGKKRSGERSLGLFPKSGKDQ